MECRQARTRGDVKVSRSIPVHECASGIVLGILGASSGRCATWLGGRGVHCKSSQQSSKRVHGYGVQPTSLVVSASTTARTVLGLVLFEVFEDLALTWSIST